MKVYRSVGAMGASLHSWQFQRCAETAEPAWASVISSRWRQTFHVMPFTDSWAMSWRHGAIWVEVKQDFPIADSRPDRSISLPSSAVLYGSTVAVPLCEHFWLHDCHCLWTFSLFYQCHSWWWQHVLLQTRLTSLLESLLLWRPLRCLGHFCKTNWC